MKKFAVLFLSMTLLVLLGDIQPAEARTTVHRDGLEITITVPIEMRGLLEMRWGNQRTGKWYEGQEIADFLEQDIQEFWNRGLAQWRYRGCYRLRLKVSVVATSRASAFSDGFHQILVVNERSFKKKNGDQVRATIFTPGITDPNQDYNLPYDQSLKGMFGRNPLRTYRHEAGHLLGLGDDYKVVKNEAGGTISVPLPGREGTIMAKGTEIDQALADRIGDLIAEDLDLPGCIYGKYEVSIEGTINQTNLVGFAEGGAYVEIFTLDDGQGGLVGQGIYSVDQLFEITTLEGCTIHGVVWIHSDPVVQTFEAVGTRQGDFIVLELPNAYDKALDESNWTTDCGAPGFDTLKALNFGLIPPAMGGTLQDGKYERETYVPWQPAFTTGGATSTEIIEEYTVESE